MSTTTTTTVTNLPQIIPHPNFGKNHLVALYVGRHVSLINARTSATVFAFDAELLSQEQLHHKHRSMTNNAKTTSNQAENTQEGTDAGEQKQEAEKEKQKAEKEGEGKKGEESKQVAKLSGANESNVSCLKFYSRQALDVDFMAVGSENKKVYLFACEKENGELTDEWKLIGSTVVRKKVSCLALAASTDKENGKLSVQVIFGDKFGDAYGINATDMWNQFQLSPEPVFVTEPPIMLGHISMLTDMIASLDEKFIITADRDEKIRVSHFPRVFEIENFCLGHSELVTCVHTFIRPSDGKEILLSGSGDGTVRVWDYLNNDNPRLEEMRVPGKIAQSIDSCRLGDTIYLAVHFEKENSVMICRYSDASHSLESVETISCGAHVTSVKFSSQGDNGALLWAISTDPGKHVALWDLSRQEGEDQELAIRPYQRDTFSVDSIAEHVSFVLDENKVTYLESMKKKLKARKPRSAGGSKRHGNNVERSPSSKGEEHTKRQKKN